MPASMISLLGSPSFAELEEESKVEGGRQEGVDVPLSQKKKKKGKKVKQPETQGDKEGKKGDGNVSEHANQACVLCLSLFLTIRCC